MPVLFSRIIMHLYKGGYEYPFQKSNRKYSVFILEDEDHFADALDLFSKRVWCAPQIADIPDIMIIEQIYHDGADALYMQLSLS